VAEGGVEGFEEVKERGGGGVVVGEDGRPRVVAEGLDGGSVKGVEVGPDATAEGVFAEEEAGEEEAEDEGQKDEVEAGVGACSVGGHCGDFIGEGESRCLRKRYPIPSMKPKGWGTQSSRPGSRG
jgi:hypothetical protein